MFFLRLTVVLPERTELVLPAPQKQFQHGAVLIRPLRETDMSVVLAAHAEGHLVAVERLEVILKLVLRLEFDILCDISIFIILSSLNVFFFSQ